MKPFVIIGTVVRGLQQGRTTGYPTINIKYDGELHARFGSYAARVQTPDGVFLGAAVIGGDFNDVAKPKCEVHLFDDTVPERYGQTAHVEFLKFISPLMRTVDPEQLRKKIEDDVAAIKKYFTQI